MESLFAVEPLIIARLKERVPGLRSVDGALDVMDAISGSRPPPAAAVIWDGESVPRGDTHQVGGEQIVEQRWLVVLGIRNVRAAATGGGLRDEAGPLLLQINATLQGWRPGLGFGRLSKAGAPPPHYQDGYAFFGLRYAVRIVMRAAP